MAVGVPSQVLMNCDVIIIQPLTALGTLFVYTLSSDNNKNGKERKNKMTYLVPHNRMAREMDRVFNSLFSGKAHGCAETDCLTPRVNIVETESDVSLSFEVPGLEKGEIKVTVTDGVLTVAGERKVETSENGENFVRNEFSFGKFSRSFTLPDNYDATRVAADYKNGLLVVSLPRKEETKPKEIEVKVG